MNRRFDFARLRDFPLYQPGTANPDPDFSTGRWAEAIDRLLAARYPFHPCRYSDDGVLFRGLAGGLKTALNTERFGHCESSQRMSEVERIMGVYFVSSELSDALSLTALHENPVDAGILVFRARVFNRRLDACAAAVLAIGDSGVVFRYPFLTEPLTLADIDYLLVPPAARDALKPVPPALNDRLLVVPPGSREATERRIAERFRHYGIAAATPEATTHYPHRR
jgi:hypothetical protein